MILSRKYNEAMDKIAVSDELKEKIMKAAEMRGESAPKSARSNVFPLRRAAGWAACLVLCAATAAVVKSRTGADIVPPPEVVTAPDDGERNVPRGNADGSETQQNVPAENDVHSAQLQPQGKDTAEGSENARNNADVPSAKPDVPHGASSAKSDIPQGTQGEVSAKPDIPQGSGSETQGSGESVQNPQGSENAEGSQTPGGADSPDETEPPLMQGAGSGLFEDMRDIDAVRQTLGYSFKLPHFMPDGFRAESVSLLFGSLVQLTYSDGESTIFFRTEKTEDDISGDYNIYETVERAEIGGAEITLKGRDGKFFTAVWNDGCAYSLYCAEGLGKETILEIAESVAE